MLTYLLEGKINNLLVRVAVEGKGSSDFWKPGLNCSALNVDCGLKDGNETRVQIHPRKLLVVTVLCKLQELFVYLPVFLKQLSLDYLYLKLKRVFFFLSETVSIYGSNSKDI